MKKSIKNQRLKIKEKSIQLKKNLKETTPEEFLERPGGKLPPH